MAYQVLIRAPAMRAGRLVRPDAAGNNRRLEENFRNHVTSLGLFISLIVILTSGVCLNAAAEEPESMVPYSMAPQRPVEISLWYAPPVVRSVFDRRGWLGDSLSPGHIQFEIREHNWLSDRSLTLFQTKLPSRFAYDAWAKVVTSYGQFFPDDVLSRARITGYDMLNPDWLYVKFTFKF